MPPEAQAGLRLIYEIEPPREPSLDKFCRQLELYGGVVDAVLIPDNHLGRPALSSVALAIEAHRHGVHPIVALNARDRNLLRLRSDLLTLHAFGIDDVLFLFGDHIAEGRTGLTVRRMLADEAPAGMRRGAVVPMDRALGWRSAADYLFAQLGTEGLASAHRIRAEGWTKPIYAGTAALASRVLAERLVGAIPGFVLPEGYLAAFDADEEAGFAAAIGWLDDLQAAGITGAHLVVPARRARFAELLGAWRSGNRD
ncbi:MAG TPA: hypothetical protein VFW71_15880 [Actinomycetota bacterium]|nr:hypothetical protein [Actinomycetota bacterium]